MSELGDIMGEEFEEKYEEKARQAREEATKISTETMMEICYEAINNEGFKGEEPRFRFTGANVNHDVLLMESPDDDLEKFQWSLGDTAKTQGMYHVDELFSLAFQENMLDLLTKIERDEYYVVVGKYEERTEQQGDGTEETYYNINPVRGIVPLNVAKKYADKYEDKMAGSSIEEQAEEQESDSSDDDSDMDLGGLDEDSGVSDDDIFKVFKHVRDEAPSVLRGVAGGDEEMIDKLVGVINQNVDGEAGKEHVLDVFEEEIDEIDGRGEDEDEDDDIDLGGIEDSDESEPSGDGSSDEPKETESSDDSSDDSDSGNSNPKDWF